MKKLPDWLTEWQGAWFTFFLWGMALNLGCAIGTAIHPFRAGTPWGGVDYFSFALNSFGAYICFYCLVEEYHRRKKQLASRHKVRKD